MVAVVESESMLPQGNHKECEARVEGEGNITIGTYLNTYPNVEVSKEISSVLPALVNIEKDQPTPDRELSSGTVSPY